jgi:hypothetical protein
MLKLFGLDGKEIKPYRQPMQLFRVTSALDPVDLPFDGDCYGGWGLPGSTCPTCSQKIRGQGFEYPEIRPDALLSNVQQRHFYGGQKGVGRVEWSTFVQRRDLLRSASSLAATVPLPPWSDLGPHRGSPHSTVPDALLLLHTTLIIRSDCLARLEQLGSP